MVSVDVKPHVSFLPKSAVVVVVLCHISHEQLQKEDTVAQCKRNLSVRTLLQVYAFLVA